jgi:hypothetical protein
MDHATLGTYHNQRFVFCANNLGENFRTTIYSEGSSAYCPLKILTFTFCLLTEVNIYLFQTSQMRISSHYNQMYFVEVPF